MEGSTNSKNVNNYTILAKYYDELLQDEEALSLWLKYIEDRPFQSVLELAAGSAVMSGILKNKGYEILASDISKDMKEVARNNYDGDYLILDMVDYHLNKKFDLVLCICDSINYLDLNQIDSFCRCAYEHLNNNGRLIFDMHDQHRLKEFSEQYIEEGYVCNVAYQWTILSDLYENTLNEHFTFYTKDGMIQEHHSQNVFKIEDIQAIVSKYFKVTIIKDFVENEKVLVIGEKL